MSDDAGTCLRAMATYNYQFAAADDYGIVGRDKVLVSQANQAPKFKEGTRTFRVVMEDVAADSPTDDLHRNATTTADNVGSPIVATDANGDTPTYSLSGSGASLSSGSGRTTLTPDVNEGGQIEVKGKLDHETDAAVIR